MKRRLILLVTTFLSLSTLGGCSFAGIDSWEKPVKIEDIKAQVLTQDSYDPTSMYVEITSFKNIQDFSYELFKLQLDETNPIISPISAYLALTLTGCGASGETLEEFKQIFGEDLRYLPFDLMQNLNKNDSDMKISLANSIWADEDMEVKNTFLTDADTYFDAEVYRRELSSNDAMKDMNIWVNAKTNGMIPSMIDEPLSEDTAMVLFNTIYFNGKWAMPFMGYDTKEYEFNTVDGEIITTPMMKHFEKHLLYVQNDLAEGVILPYKDEDIFFLALKPVEGMDVREMYEQLSWDDISDFLEQEETTLSRLRLPKFEVSFEKELNDSLKEMGLEKAFDPVLADLSGLGSVAADGENLYISLVKQKAKLILDEEGTEASAATRVDIKTESAMEYVTEPVKIYFDEPFFYMILHKSKNIPLFMGIMDKPEN